MRNFLVVFHRWLGLVIGIVLLVVALSGAVLVLESPVADAHAVHVTHGNRPLSLDSLAILVYGPSGADSVTSVSFGRTPDEVYAFSSDRGPDIQVNPYTGQVLGPVPSPSRAIRILQRIHQFHTSLLAGRTGRSVVALVTLGALLLVLTGVVIWWREKLWRIRWSASWKRIAFDIHHALGVIASLVLLFVAGTGVWMGFERQIDPLVLSLNQSPPFAGPPRQGDVPPGTRPVSLDSLIHAAERAVPGAPMIFMQLPAGEPAVIGLRYPEDHTPAGRSRVFIDRYRGTAVRVLNTRTAETGTRVMNLQRPLHTGDIFGNATRLVWFLAAVILASQAVTGSLMWWNARRGREALQRNAGR